jgi:hypothetical protein
MYRLAYRNFGDHEALVVNHSIATTSGNVGVRWYEIRNPGGPPTIYQQGSYAPDTSFRWVGSLAMDKVGDIALGYSVSSISVSPSIRYTGRLFSDASGTMGSETSVVEGSGSQVGSNRWGDYTSMSVDPVDDCTFWYTNEYLQSAGSKNWRTHIASFSFPACTGPLSPVTLSKTSLDFATQQVGTTSGPQLTVLTNNQDATLTISSLDVSGDFSQSNDCGTSVAPGGSCTISVNFTPAVLGARLGQITIGDDASTSPQVVTLSGTGVAPTVSLTPTTLSFGGLPLGTPSVLRKITLSNSGFGSLNITSIASSGNYTETDTCGATVSPGGSCTINVLFTPWVPGALPGAITLTNNAAASPQVVSLSGTGLTPISLSPATVSFGDIAVGSTSAAQTVTLTNNLAGSLNFTFSASGNYSAGGSGASPCGASLAAQAKCTMAVTFAPTVNGSMSGALTVTYGSSFSPQQVTLSGNGTGGVSSPLTFSPANLVFAKTVLASTSLAKMVTVTNTGSTVISNLGITASGNFQVASGGSKPCGTTLAANAKCTFTVAFIPSVAATITGAVSLSSSTVTSVYKASGTGVLPVTFSPSPLTFPAQTVGSTSSPITVAVNNNQAIALNIASITASGQFSVTMNIPNGCSSSVPALGSCAFAVSFAPATSGAINGVVTVVHDASFSPQIVKLSGTGQ